MTLLSQSSFVSTGGLTVGLNANCLSRIDADCDTYLNCHQIWEQGSVDES
jgi:hypothetical protein